MSRPYSPDRGTREHLEPRWIKWQKPRDPPAHAQSSMPAASGSGSPEPPEGLLFEDLNRFKEALETLPRRCDRLAVPQFFDKQLVVLEDLGRDWVKTIGKAFHVPARVFALHWASPSLYKRGRARLPLGQPAEEHFVLPYSEILPFAINNRKSLPIEDHPNSVRRFAFSNLIVAGNDYFKLDCASVRFASSDMQQDQETDKGRNWEREATNSTCEAMVSYWGSLENHEEWTGKHSPRLRAMKL